MFQTIPTITYFALPKKHAGRAEPIRLCLEDAEIRYNFQEITLDWTTWPKHKSDIMANGFRCGTLPIMELEGRKYSQTNAILMYLCRRLGKYLGDDIEEQYKVNQAADLCADGIQLGLKLLSVARWVNLSKLKTFIFFGTNFATAQDTHMQHLETKSRHFLGVAEALLSETTGPYLLSDKITFADFLLFQNARDEYTAQRLLTIRTFLPLVKH